MKKHLILLLLIGLSFSAFAKKVEEQAARNVAVNRFNENAGEMKYALSSISETFYETKGDETLLYIFNISDDGFIIVPADDNVRPVLGWSMENLYTLENHPPQFDYFLRMYKAAVKLGDDYKEEGVDPNQEWERLAVNPNSFSPQKRGKSVGPLLTCYWDQCYDWNIYCPYDANAVCWNSRVPVGCVATAMAQIMYYWKYPNTGEGSHGYNSNYGYLSANFGNTSYQWSQMDDYNGTNASALLSYHCGISVDMDYGPYGSGAYSTKVDDAFEDHFRYDNDASFKSRYSNYTNWVNLLASDINLGRPIYYSGCEPGEGCHAWVVDGYTSGDEFHVNYGWGGFGGWYSIANVPYYINDQDAVVYIYPEIPNNLVLDDPNMTGTYTAYSSVTLDPGFSTGTSAFVAQVHEPNKGSTVRIYFKGELISELVAETDFTSVYPDIWNGIDASGNKAKPGEYTYTVLKDGIELETGTLIIE